MAGSSRAPKEEVPFGIPKKLTDEEAAALAEESKRLSISFKGEAKQHLERVRGLQAQVEAAVSAAKPAVAAAPSSPAPSTPAAKGLNSPRNSGGLESGGVQAFSNSSNESSPAPSPQHLGQLKSSPAAAAHKPPTESRLRRPVIASLPRASPPRGSSPRSSPRASEVDDEVLDFEELPE